MYRNHVFEIQSIWEVKIVAGDWKKSVGEFIDTANEAMGAANSVLNAANDARETYRYFQDNKGYRYSEKGQSDYAEAKRIEKIDEAVCMTTAILIILMIVVTIVLCVMGNDIVLRLLHI